MNTLREAGRKISLLTHIGSLLGWDQEVYMPSQAINERAEQLSYMEGLIHDMITADDLGAALNAAGASDEHPRGKADLSDIDAAYVRVLYKHFSRQKKLPKSLVVEFARQSSIAQNKWVEARDKNDFSIFKPHLSRLLELTAEKIEKLGFEDHPYDALLDEYEPDTKTAYLKPVFAELREGLKGLVKKIAETNQVDDSFLTMTYPRDKQEDFGRMVLKDIGYDFERGRLDVSAHPFTTTLGVDDVRITTRYSDNFFNTGFFGIVHEAGHGLYELGFSDKIKGNILAEGTSLGIHESQSRMWENMIGRSFEFWQFYYTKLQEAFPEVLHTISVEQFYRGINKVEPSLIRVEADEVTYNLHIILRFELELALVSGNLQVDDLPDAWNKTFQELLGITPPNNAEGVLQDIHWSMGAFGYFPTYSLGNMYAAQFFSYMGGEIGDLNEIIASGRFSEVLSWLRANIHSQGSLYTAEELCNKITGESLNPSFLLNYITKKYGTLYGLSGN